MKSRLVFISLAVTLSSTLAIFYAVAKAQEQPGCFIINSSGQVSDLGNLCNSKTREGEDMPNRYEEAFQNARQLAKAGQYQAAVDEYSRAIELNPEMVEAYSFRSAAFAMIPGQEQRGIEDARKAAEILRARGDEERARWMDAQAESVQGVIEERRMGIE
ncbi:tetratricopeptide repeat protein [Geitlerinema sp. PCC 7407]|uniref:tetratricopeptide repeat protein n=1 Tax=Geitlerinema sp. PCC 7407 TaxID=1173025 RepID=UPI00123735FD|nr:tetratricopeptide repeat protein [Geitlerinema sp. PCC 7407]